MCGAEKSGSKGTRLHPVPPTKRKAEPGRAFHPGALYSARGVMVRVQTLTLDFAGLSRLTAAFRSYMGAIPPRSTDLTWYDVIWASIIPHPNRADSIRARIQSSHPTQARSTIPFRLGGARPSSRERLALKPTVSPVYGLLNLTARYETTTTADKTIRVMAT